MTPLDYIKRAYSELTGGRKIPGKSKTGDFKLNQPMILFGALGLLLATLIIGVVISILPNSGNASDDCAFKIPEEDGPASLQNICVTLEKAASPSKQRLGLSNREFLARDRGMIFDFQTPQKSCMWMKDMNFSLDMMWLDEQGKIVAIKEHVHPDTFPAAFCGPDHARYIIEVNAGIIKEAGLKKGHGVNI